MASNTNCKRKSTQQATPDRIKNRQVLKEMFREILFPSADIFADCNLHGNVKWKPDQLVSQAILFSWQGDRFLIDAFDYSLKVCTDMGLNAVAYSYTSLFNALAKYTPQLRLPVRKRLHDLAESVAGSCFRIGKFVPIAFDGSRVTTPRTASNEQAFCAANYGQGKTAKYRKKQTKGMRRTKNEKNKPHHPKPQVWLTMLWHMGLKLPWTWKTGPSNSSERAHVVEMLEEETFPQDAFFCGDAGFIGYPLWSLILRKEADFLVRVGANVQLLATNMDYEKKSGGIVYCWPKGKRDSGAPPLRLRLVKVKIGRAKVWLLTSVVDSDQLNIQQMIRMYKMRWGVEVEFRGLKQTVDKHTLGCRTSARVTVELDWSLFALAFAELLALREQLPSSTPLDPEKPIRLSLAETMRALRLAMRERNETIALDSSLWNMLKEAVIQQYVNKTDKKARYRPANPDKKPLGDPQIRKLELEERRNLRRFGRSTAA